VEAGIVSWGVYLPYWRLERRAMGDAFGTGGGRGRRAVASYDEDTTSMAVEAGRRALGMPGVPASGSLFFSTPAPAYLDKTNATTVHAGLGLSPDHGAYDLCGSVRSGWATNELAALSGQRGPALAVVSDLRTGLPGSLDESQGGDGAVAILYAPGGGVTELIGRAAATDEFLDRWRVPGETGSHQWEDRFGEEAYVPLARSAFTRVLEEAGLGVGDIDHLIVTGLHARAVASLKKTLGVPADRVVPDHAALIGNLGAAQGSLELADVLERGTPGQVVAMVEVADGADAVLLRTTDALPAVQAARREAGVRDVADLVGDGRSDLAYAVFLSWRGMLRREPPRRPDPERPDAPAMRRTEGWKFGFNASRCLVCGFRHLPPTRICLSCHSVDRMESERMADLRGTVATYTVDRLAFSLSPPMVGAVIDFDGGGRYRGEMTDVDPGTVVVGTRVEMTFRRLYSAEGVHNYFWKARPVPAGADDGPGGQLGSEGGQGT
jgi:hydroxymethylglutaryl-CoA synthase